MSRCIVKIELQEVQKTTRILQIRGTPSIICVVDPLPEDLQPIRIRKLHAPESLGNEHVPGLLVGVLAFDDHFPFEGYCAAEKWIEAFRLATLKWNELHVIADLFEAIDLGFVGVPERPFHRIFLDAGVPLEFE